MNIEEILQKGIDSLNDKERDENYKNFIGGIEYSKEKILPYLEEKDKEIERLNKALEEIQTILIKKQKAKGFFNQLLNVQEERCLDIVNKALGSDKE